jgi:hypothetical protein
MKECEICLEENEENNFLKLNICGHELHRECLKR